MEKPAKPNGRLCTLCNEKRAALKRPKTLEQVLSRSLNFTVFFFLKVLKFCSLSEKICRECFYTVFEDEIHRVIVDNQLFKPGERIAIGASGGKGL